MLARYIADFIGAFRAIKSLRVGLCAGWLAVVMMHMLTVQAQLLPGALLSGDATGFDTVEAVSPLQFPRDHGPHLGYRSEWWYVTGHLLAPDGREFGLQLTFFRFRLRPPPVASAGAARIAPAASSWRTDHVWMAHFAITDVATGQFHSFERFSRGGRLGLAGATAVPFEVWLEDWSIRSTADNAEWPWRLRANDGVISMDLVIDRGRRPTPQGDNGFSRKGNGIGNASYYYSMTRLSGQGSLRIGNKTIAGPVTLWIDREWSSSALAANQVGWDWFGLHLDDGRDLMLYRMRRRDGSTDPFSAATLIEADGSTRKFSSDAFVVTPSAYTSLASGRQYPLLWRLQIPQAHVDLEVRGTQVEQEHDGLIPYWEGLVRAFTSDGTLVGRGYLEMTGYTPAR